MLRFLLIGFLIANSFQKELVYLSGAIGSTPSCAKGSCGLCGVWQAYPCVSKLLAEESFPNDTFLEHQLHPFAKKEEFRRILNYEKCPLQPLFANEKDPVYTKTVSYPSFSGFVSTRWAVWLIVDSNTGLMAGAGLRSQSGSQVWMAEPSGGTTPQPSRRSGTATLSMMLQSKTGSQEWCNGQGVINKWCKWYNYTINDCNDDYTTSSKPLVSIYAVPDQLNTFGTVQNFDVLYQNCTNRCGIAKLSCCD
jgi:hypothetical protein